ncbi:CAMK family protein kinase [Histomonas meleagridis]|uniref:CAMK family protein kinase n=1 Tax=Histomonas meleagridis TaxID=135588 RepID=UPI00355AA745|nr:CAMK family protein kinase [Histomonas meleagridis]KAH0801365.1 CAMK family protein kinase [Histomonas meleagridis]
MTSKKAHLQLNSVKQEISVLQESTHPLISTFITSFEDEQNYYICQEHLPTKTLTQHIQEKGTLAETDARHFFCELFVIIEYLHKNRKIFLRSLSTDSIVIDANDNIRIFDFSDSIKIEKDSEIYHDVCGQIEYSPPEMLKDLGYSKEIDLWYLAVILYKMVTGSPPFTGKTNTEISEHIKYKEARFPPNLSNSLVDLLNQMLQKSPLSRPSIDNIKKHSWFSLTEYFLISRLSKEKLSWSSDILTAYIGGGYQEKPLRDQIERNEYGFERIIYQSIKSSQKEKFIKDTLTGAIPVSTNSNVIKRRASLITKSPTNLNAREAFPKRVVARPKEPTEKEPFPSFANNNNNNNNVNKAQNITFTHSESEQPLAAFPKFAETALTHVKSSGRFNMKPRTTVQIGARRTSISPLSPKQTLIKGVMFAPNER